MRRYVQGDGAAALLRWRPASVAASACLGARTRPAQVPGCRPGGTPSRAPSRARPAQRCRRWPGPSPDALGERGPRAGELYRIETCRRADGRLPPSARAPREARPPSFVRSPTMAETSKPSGSRCVRPRVSGACCGFGGGAGGRAGPPLGSRRARLRGWRLLVGAALGVRLGVAPAAGAGSRSAGLWLEPAAGPPCSAPTGACATSSWGRLLSARAVPLPGGGCSKPETLRLRVWGTHPAPSLAPSGSVL